MKTPREKYMSDCQYKVLIDTMCSYVHSCHYTPSEIREAAVLALDTIHEWTTSVGAVDTTKQDYEHDILVLVLRLLGEDPDTFSPEVAEVMMKWEDKVKSVLAGNHVYEL